MEDEKRFLEWLRGMQFYVGEARYSQYSGNIVIVATYGRDEEIRELVDDLCASDIPALDAAHKLDVFEGGGVIWIDSDDNPVKAMEKLMVKVRKTYFEEINV